MRKVHDNHPEQQPSPASPPAHEQQRRFQPSLSHPPCWPVSGLTNRRSLLPRLNSPVAKRLGVFDRRQAERTRKTRTHRQAAKVFIDRCGGSPARLGSKKRISVDAAGSRLTARQEKSVRAPTLRNYHRYMQRASPARTFYTGANSF